VRAFLVEHGASTVPQVASGVRARQAEVRAVVTQEGFSLADPPAGATPHGIYYVSSRLVPRIAEGSRAAVLLGILADGEWHGRAEILAEAGRAFLTNNAAAELRRAGHVVEFSAKSGYRLVSLAAPEVSPSPLSASGAASETRERVAA
jgi:hypothetical protein